MDSTGGNLATTVGRTAVRGLSTLGRASTRTARSVASNQTVRSIGRDVAAEAAVGYATNQGITLSAHNELADNTHELLYNKLPTYTTAPVQTVPQPVPVVYEPVPQPTQNTQQSLTRSRSAIGEILNANSSPPTVHDYHHPGMHVNKQFSSATRSQTASVPAMQSRSSVAYATQPQAASSMVKSPHQYTPHPVIRRPRLVGYHHPGTNGLVLAQTRPHEKITDRLHRYGKNVVSFAKSVFKLAV